jgi:hypothetical protein
MLPLRTFERDGVFPSELSVGPAEGGRRNCNITVPGVRLSGRFVGAIGARRNGRDVYMTEYKQLRKTDTVVITLRRVSTLLGVMVG